MDLNNPTNVAISKLVPGLAKLLEDMQNLYKNEELADILFIVGREEKKTFAHKIILKTRCRSFHSNSIEDFFKMNGCPVIYSDIITIKLPMYAPDTFSDVIIYIYTANITFHDSKIIEVLTIAHDFGMDDLKNLCKEHILSTMTVLNACNFLEDVINLHEGILDRQFINKIIVYIGKNAAECVQTKSFLNLSQKSVIKLISSDMFGLKEEDVFRSCLTWAKHKAGVTQNYVNWNAEDKSKICTELTPIIKHIRLLLIDSKVFAEEVEPTGCVPIEFVLERYRFAALSGNQQNDQLTQNLISKYLHNEKKNNFVPRLSNLFFTDSDLLRDERSHFQMILNSWLGSDKQTWKMIYKASTHGFSSKLFHQRCDGVAPLYIIITDDKHNLAGGFTDVPFEVKKRLNGYIYSDNSFLFRLGAMPQKFPVKKKVYALYYHKNFGPIFGGGADLSISNECHQNCISYSNLQHSYGGEDPSVRTLFGSYNFKVLDYEVFTLSK